MNPKMWAKQVRIYIQISHYACITALDSSYCTQVATAVYVVGSTKVAGFLYNGTSVLTTHPHVTR